MLPMNHGQTGSKIRIDFFDCPGIKGEEERLSTGDFSQAGGFDQERPHHGEVGESGYVGTENGAGQFRPDCPGVPAEARLRCSRSMEWATISGEYPVMADMAGIAFWRGS